MDGMFAAIEAAFDAEPNSTLRDDGDATALPDGAISADYRVPFLAHSTMEPQGATAWLQDGRMTLWAGNQAPRRACKRPPKPRGWPRTRSPAHHLHGRRVRAARRNRCIAQVARIAAEMPGTPIRLTWSREEDMGHDFYRPAAMARMQGAVDHGRISHFNAAIAAPSVTRAAMTRIMGTAPGGADKGHVEGAFDQPYAIPNYRVAGHLADLDVPIGFWRSVGASFNGFFHESFVDELAHAAGADPLAFRLAHVAPESAVAAGVLTRVRDMSGWDTPLPEGRARGVAMTWSFGTPTAVVIELARDGDRIRIDRAFMACDPGLALDPGIIRAQMESGLIYGLSAAVMGEITFTNGRADQANFPDYDALRMFNVPRIEVAILQDNPHMGGVGEPGTPPSMPALANALFALTGTRARSLPLRDVADFGV